MAEYPDFEKTCGYGSVTGILGANCRHSFFPFIEGVSERTWTDEELANIDPPPFTFEGRTYTAYQATQKQRALERNIRKLKREKAAYQAAGLEEDAAAAGARIRRLTDEYKAFSKAADLPTQTERMEVYSTDAASEAKAARRAEEAANALANSGERGIIEENREMANGLRRSYFIPMSEDEKEFVLREIDAIKADRSVFVFRDGAPTGYIDERDKIFVSSSVFPSNDDSADPTDLLSVRATLAHEYYGHRSHRGTKLPAGAWNDEFRASYVAAVEAPGLSEADREMLIHDAITRAKRAGVSIKLNGFMRRCLYGTE